MTMTCTICSHPEREAIDRDLILGKSTRAIARQYGTSKDAPQRHREHIASAIEEARSAARKSVHREVSSLTKRVARMCDHAEALMEDAVSKKSAAAILSAIRELRPSLELLGKSTGEIVTTTTQLLVQLGVRDDQELRSLVDLARGAQNLTLDDCELDGVELLRMVLTQRPERRAAIVSALGREASGAEVVEAPQANGNGSSSLDRG